MEFTVVEKRRVIQRFDSSLSPQCPALACTRKATHEVKRGPKMVYRGCRHHAERYAEAAEAHQDVAELLGAV